MTHVWLYASLNYKEICSIPYENASHTGVRNLPNPQITVLINTDHDFNVGRGGMHKFYAKKLFDFQWKFSIWDNKKEWAIQQAPCPEMPVNNNTVKKFPEIKKFLLQFPEKLVCLLSKKFVTWRDIFFFISKKEVHEKFWEILPCWRENWLDLPGKNTFSVLAFTTGLWFTVIKKKKKKIKTENKIEIWAVDRFTSTPIY